MELVLVGVDIVLQIDLDIAVHLCIYILAQKATDDSDALSHVSGNMTGGFRNMRLTPKLRDARVVILNANILACGHHFVPKWALTSAHGHNST